MPVFTLQQGLSESLARIKKEWPGHVQTVDPANNNMTLGTIQNGQSVRVIGIKEDGIAGQSDILRLSDMGIVAGQRLSVIKRAPFGDPMQIEIMGYQLCLRKEHADCIEVELNDSKNK